LPQRLRASSLSDGAQFVPALERLYRDAWRRHLLSVDPLDRRVREGDAPTLRQLLVARANAAVQARDLLPAIDALETLSLAMPGDLVERNLSRAWNNLGVAHRRAGRSEAARQALRTALAIWPQNPEAAANL